MRLLYIVLLLCTLAVLGTAVAIYVRVRGHMRKPVNDTVMREASDDTKDSRGQKP